MAPFFSIVIPTRNRAWLAKTAVEHVLRQSFANFEVLILENSDSPELTGCFSDSRVRVVTTDRVLSMPDNWERALDLALGDYVMYLADKDWLVPYALSELNRVIHAKAPDIVNYRKASWDPEWGLQMQHATGLVTQLPSAPVLERWFSGVNHLHNSPMILNSAVRREILLAVRSRLGGRFFHGTAPDVASGVLLLNHIDTYTLVDRVYAMAYTGEWSIGAAQLKFGRRGAAARFAEEFGTDPLADAGLMWSVSGVVAETLIACQLSSNGGLRHRINWRQYIENCWEDIGGWAAAGQDTSKRVALLRAGVGRWYPWSTWVRGAVARRFRPLRPLITMLRSSTPLKVLFPPHRRLRRMLGFSPVPEVHPGISFIDKDCFLPIIPSPKPDDGWATVLDHGVTTTLLTDGKPF